MKKLIDKLAAAHELTKSEYLTLLENRDEPLSAYLFEQARKARHEIYGHDVYMRGLIEFSSYCKNDCLYCGLRAGNKHAERYRLSKSQILDCCHIGYKLGFRTFVLQSGEDPFFTTDKLADIVRSIKAAFADCAVTLSVGEREYDEYKALKDAGADRYLLRHETADKTHYGQLHPPQMSAAHRKQCLYNLKELGYQVGCGFMVGSPFQTLANLADDLLFVKQLQPDMVGIGPFIPHSDTPFAGQAQGTLELTLFMLGLLRLTVPHLLLPATTALGTIDFRGRESGILAGANVVMPNLSPVEVRKKYMIYDNKICTGDEASECVGCMTGRMKSIGYHVVVSRGDCIKPNTDNDKILQ